MRNRLLLGIAPALAAFAVACASSKGVVALAQSPEEHPVDVKLTMKDGKCGVKAADVRPDSTPAKRSRRDKVKWKIENGCTSTLAEVKIVFEKNNGANNDTHPFEGTCNKVLTNLDPGKVKTIKCQVRGNADYYKYKYWIYINGVAAVDPDVEVWD